MRGKSNTHQYSQNSDDSEIDHDHKWAPFLGISEIRWPTWIMTACLGPCHFGPKAEFEGVRRSAVNHSSQISKWKMGFSAGDRQRPNVSSPSSLCHVCESGTAGGTKDSLGRYSGDQKHLLPIENQGQEIQQTMYDLNWGGHVSLSTAHWF